MNISAWVKRPWFLVLTAFVLLAGLVLVLRRLNMAMPQENLAVTQAYVTISSRLTAAVHSTQISFENTPEVQPVTLTPELVQPTATLLAVDTTQTLPADIPQITSSPTQPCDQAAPGIPMDITVPDESEFYPGESFTKIWRLQNVGTCIWTGDYAARFFFGDRMGASEVVYLGSQVNPGDIVDIAVDMQAPNEPGTYQGNWKMINGRGQLFGIGPKGDAPFWVRIIVLRVATQTFTPTITPTPTLTLTPPVTPTVTPTPTVPVESSGDLALKIDQLVDLDTGKNEPPAGLDLRFGMNSPFHVLVPQNTAVLGVVGLSQPGLATCQTAGLSQAPIAIESLSPGIYLCYYTDAGRYGWLRYDSLDEESIVDLAYHTWAIP